MATIVARPRKDGTIGYTAQIKIKRGGRVVFSQAQTLFSTRRQEEITRIRWTDLGEGRVLVRDMKHPGDKMGNDTWCGLPPEAEAIARAMPKVAPEIFPFSSDAISAAFTRACKTLEIEDLRFHDLRHEGASHLFEMGWTISACCGSHRPSHLAELAALFPSAPDRRQMGQQGVERPLRAGLRTGPLQGGSLALFTKANSH